MATASVPHSHRRAYGSHRAMSPAVKAANVARSIAQRRTEGRAWTWADYGLQANPAQQALVLAALAQGRWAAHPSHTPRAYVVAFYVAEGVIV